MGIYIPNGLFKASLFDPATGTTVQFNNLNPAMVLFDMPLIKGVHTTGEYQSGNTYRFSCGGYGITDSGVEQLRTWKTNRTPVRAVGAGFGKNIQWYESVLIEELLEDYKPNRSEGDNSFGFVLRKDGTPGVTQIFNNQNLLAFLGWADANSDGFADNYTRSNVTGGFTSGVQTLASTSSVAVFQTDFVFPISGIELTASLKVDAESGNVQLYNEVYNFAASRIGQDIINYESGIIESNLTLPASSYGVQLILAYLETAETCQISFPALTTNGKLTPGTSFMNY